MDEAEAVENYQNVKFQVLLKEYLAALRHAQWVLIKILFVFSYSLSPGDVDWFESFEKKFMLISKKHS